MDNLLKKQYVSLIQCNHEMITILSNTSAFIKQNYQDISWAGFYLLKDNELILGPFQGKVACTNIPLNKGVCGTSAYLRETIVVENVHLFKGHIACDSESNSEIVVPIIKNNELFGVLDLDSTSIERFTDTDKIIFEDLVSILVKYL